MQNIIHVLDIQAPQDKILHALNSEEGLSQWWTKKVFFEDNSNGPIHFAFMGDFNPIMIVENTENEVVWKCIDGVPAWKNDELKFQLQLHNDGTTVQFTHHLTNDLNDEQIGRFNYIWGYYMQSLRLYCEEGKGNPFEI